MQDCDLTVGEPEGVFLDLYAVLRAERGPKVESDALEILETWQRTERLCENILKLCDLKLITGACTGLSVAWERKQRHEKKTYPQCQLEGDKIAHDRVDHTQPRGRGG